MTKDEALQMCLEYIETDAHERKYVRHAIKQALSAPVQKGAIGAEYQKSPWDEKGISMPLPAAQQEPHKGLSDHLAQTTNGRVYVDPVTGDVGIGTSAAPVQEPVAGQPLPCPFCGHIGLDFSDGETYRWGVASCSGCGASCGDVRREYPDQGEWHTEAIAEWNRRSPAAPDLQAELDATNRQVEILSDALAESRREVDAIVALARADERESCAKVCDRMAARCNDIRAAALESAAENIRARGETK